MSDFYLVQRLSRQDPGVAQRKTGFDKAWALDYMGSSEFESGAQFRSLKRIRTAPVEVTTRTLTIGDVTRDVFFVAQPTVAEERWEQFLTWTVGGQYSRPFRVCEWTLFPELFAGEPREYLTVDGWWALDSDVAWALTVEDAQALADAFNAGPA